MSALPSTAFSSVKLSSALVTEAKQAAQTLRRSTAGQIEYWALLGKALEDGGLTTREATNALDFKNSHTTSRGMAHALDQIEAQFTQAQSTGSLATRMRDIVQGNRARAA
jgi:ParD-like antitoxin of type II bacterial toxin-antitoxin system